MSVTVRRFVVAAMSLAVATVTLVGQQSETAPAQTAPTFRSGVEAVQVDAYVTDASGRPVLGLTKDDFEVFENGQQREIVTFAPVEISTDRPVRRAVDVEPDVLTNSEPPGRVYLFMLSGMEADMALRTRQLLHRFMDEYFGETDLAAVVVARGLVTDGQDFTHNQRLIRAAIDKWSGDAGNDPRDFQARMEFMARMPGNRKFVLWFTDVIGFDSYDVVDYHGGVPSLTGEYVHSAMAAATRGNIRIYPISPSGLTTELGPRELERRMDFRAVADVTGGFAQVGSNDFEAAFARLVRETSTYYVLGIESSGARKQGRYVRLEVKAKRPGLEVRARPGYVEQLEFVRRRAKPEEVATPARRRWPMRCR